MLSETEKIEIEKEMELFPFRSAVCIDALKIVQKHRGWISDDAIRDIASHLRMTEDEVDAVSTFYTRIYRKPVGRNVILVCEGISCMILGYQALYKHLSEKLGIGFGETTRDERFTLLPVSCLGDCDHAPVLMINNDTYNNITPAKLDLILDKYK